VISQESFWKPASCKDGSNQNNTVIRFGKVTMSTSKMRFLAHAFILLPAIFWQTADSTLLRPSSSEHFLAGAAFVGENAASSEGFLRASSSRVANVEPSRARTLAQSRLAREDSYLSTATTQGAHKASSWRSQV
jgi:hypothetical protein